ncbi:MAG: hypothetical protein MUC64_09095 [Rubritepida sp.]|nr:hypothetical protein [Rubritepida sp.]
MPLGGAHHARRQAERRLDEAREAVAMLATRITAGCEAEGLDFRARHEEGDATRLLAVAAAQQDVIVMPRGAWFDQAQVLAPGEAARRAAEIGLPGTLLATPGLAPPARLHFLHEGDAASTEALRRFLALGLFPEAPLEISVLDVVGGVELAEAARLMALAAGRSVGPLGPPLPAEDAPPPEGFAGATLAVIPARSIEGHGAWRALRDMAAPVFLA